MMSPQKIFAVAGPRLGTGVTRPGEWSDSPAQDSEGDTRLPSVCRRPPFEMLSEPFWYLIRKIAVKNIFRSLAR